VLGAGAVAAAGLAHVEAHVACEEHLARGQELATRVGQRSEHAFGAEGGREQLVLQRPVLNRQRDIELRRAQWLERRGGTRCLARDEQRAGAAQRARVAQSGDCDGELGEAADREPVLLEVGGARAARQHRDAVAGARQMGAEDRADGAGAQYGEIELGHRAAVRRSAPRARRRCPAGDRCRAVASPADSA
jgi:hypothetical protein